MAAVGNVLWGISIILCVCFFKNLPSVTPTELVLVFRGDLQDFHHTERFDIGLTWDLRNCSALQMHFLEWNLYKFVWFVLDRLCFSVAWLWWTSSAQIVRYVCGSKWCIYSVCVSIRHWRGVLVTLELRPVTSLAVRGIFPCITDCIWAISHDFR